MRIRPVVALMVAAALSLVVACLGVGWLVVAERADLTIELHGRSIGEAEDGYDTVQLRSNPEQMRVVVMAALIDRATDRAPVVARIDEIDQSFHRRIWVQAARRADEEPLLRDVLGAWTRFRDTCVGELDRRATSPTAPDALTAAEDRVTAAIDKLERARDLPALRESEREMARIQHRYGRARAAVGVLAVSSLFTAAAGGSLALRRRRARNR